MATKMTREEVIKIVQSATVWTDEERDALAMLIPELAESEDEKIRKELKEAFEAYDIESTWNGIPIRSIFAWLEKQKENPKPADSIPSDYTSDVKCEDRWHKVTDSLPDNGRLVLAKDCLGNVLLARYDGENWEVNVYDNEDHYCHNSISKWCEIPSEKQKECVSNNFDDVWDEEDCEEIIAEGQKLTPRFKELLKEVCHAWYDRGAKLEKQKEQKPVEWNDTDMKEARDNLISVCRDWERGEQTTLLPIAALRARYFLEHLTEPKPVEWSEEDEKQGSQKSLRTTKETDVI